MSRLLANCSTTTTSSSSSSVTTICDCECEGCCCQYIQYSISGVSLVVTYTFTAGVADTPPSFGTCLGYNYGEDIWYIGAFFDECPTPANWSSSFPDQAFFIHTTPPPITIPNAGDYDCITLIFYDYNGAEATRCTVKFNP